MSNAIFWVIIVLSTAMSYSIGANDAANALGTSYGSNAARLWMLLALGAVFEFIGAVFCSQKVAGTLANKLLPTLDEQSIDVQERLMLGVCLASFSFILVSSIFGMPISGTHTVIGALIGAGLAGLQASTLNWGKFGMTVASWFISPVLSSVIAGLLFLLICSTVLKGHIKATSTNLHLLTFISAISVTFSAYMVTSLAANEPTGMLYLIVCSASFVTSWFATRFLLTFAAYNACQEKMSVCEILNSTFGFWSYQTILSRTCHTWLSDVAHAQEKRRLVYEDNIIDFAFRCLLVQAACLVCLAHGSNDVANSIAPLLVELNINSKNTAFAYWIGGAGIAVGLVTLGYKVMETVGKKVIKLDFYKGFSCQFATANCIIMGSRLGIPLSTTHCAVGSLFGIVLCNKVGFVKEAYKHLAEVAQYQIIVDKDEEKAIKPKKLHLQSSQGSQSEFSEEGTPVTNYQDHLMYSQENQETSTGETTESKEEVRDENSINLGTVKKILLFWGLTVPVAMGVSYGFSKLLLINAQ